MSRNALTLALGAALLGGAAFAAWRLLPGALGRKGEPPPPAAKLKGLPADFEARVEAAADLDAPLLLREAWERFGGTPEGERVRSLRERRCLRARESLGAEMDRLLGLFRYRSAADLANRYRLAWNDAEMDARFREVRDLQSSLVADREKRANELLDAGRIEAARESVWTSWELEEPYRRALVEASDRIEARIARRAPSSPATPAVETRPGEKPPESSGALPGPVPPLPAAPHPDVKRLALARDLFRRARELYAAGKFEPSARAVRDLVGFYPDLAYVKSRREGIDALLLLCRHGTEGVVGLFHAAEARRSGGRLLLRYRFATPEEMLDWEAMPTIPHADDGAFEKARDGVQGTGVMTYLLRALFQNDVTIRCRSFPNRLKTHGLAFCQQGDETRQILLLATNHWFVEGENYVKERPGHSLVMIGKGTNNDVPVDSPEIGFIFRVTRETPEAREGDELLLSFTLRGAGMEAEVECDGRSSQLRGEARGDDGRGIERVRPALFVVQNSVVFRDVAIEGPIHPKFERDRVDELLQAVDALR